MQDLVGAYRRTRDRMARLILAADEAGWEHVVPACAPWRCRDLLAHVVSMPAALVAGERPDGAVGDWLERLVRRYAEVPVADLVKQWQDLDDALAGLLTGPSELLFGDLAIHEHDLRGALHQPDHAALEVDVLMPRTLAAFANPLRAAGLGAIEVRAGERAWRSHDAEPGWTLLTDAWTAVRAVNSRRTAAELRALPARGDAGPYLPILDAHLPLPRESLGE